jgi:sialidase-1
MTKSTLRNLEIREVVTDPTNFIAEASLDASADRVVMVYGRYRGMKHTDDGSIVFTSSNDFGRTWESAAATIALEQFDDWGFTSPGVKILQDGTILVVAHANGLVGDAVGRTNRFRGAFAAWSKDGGRTWSRPEPIQAWPFRHINIWDNPEVAEDGSLLLAVSGTVANANIHGTYAESSRSGLLRSTDNGRHWYCHGTIAYDTAGIHSFYEPSIVCTDINRLVSLSRQHYAISGGSPPGGYLFASASDDGGASWSGYHRTPLWGYPPDLVRLGDGRVLCVYGHRKDPASIKIAVSDDGFEWSEEQTVEIYRPPKLTDGPDEGRLDSGYRHIGYPSAVQLANGTVLVAFHSFSEIERKQIILLASFEL